MFVVIRNNNNKKKMFAVLKNVKYKTIVLCKVDFKLFIVHIGG